FGANMSATFQDSQHHRLVSLSQFADALVTVNVAGLSSDEGFVYFNLLSFTAELPALWSLQAQTDTLQHKPCRLLCNPQSAVQFIAADSVLAVGQHPYSGHPLIQAKGGILEDGSNL